MSLRHYVLFLLVISYSVIYNIKGGPHLLSTVHYVGHKGVEVP
jgi:hypothetical protein